MEDTASTVAGKEGVESFDASMLFEPTVNVRLGTAYMKELSKELGNHPALIIAGYNAGESNVSRWLGKRGGLPLDLWVEDIPYGQTRKYTKRVLSTFWTYKWLYGSERVPDLSFELK